MNSIAERFRSYALLCRDLATRMPSHAQCLRERARQWERDADLVERNLELMESTGDLLKQIDRMLQKETMG